MKFNQDLCLNLRYDFGKMNSTLGSVVPLAMFKNQTQLDLKYLKLLWVGVSEFPQSGGALKLQTLTLMIQVWVVFWLRVRLGFQKHAQVRTPQNSHYSDVRLEDFNSTILHTFFLLTKLECFKLKPSILVFGILNTESRKTFSPPLPSSAPWDGRRFAWLCSETKIREGAEHQRKVSHPT